MIHHFMKPGPPPPPWSRRISIQVSVLSSSRRLSSSSLPHSHEPNSVPLGHYLFIGRGDGRTDHAASLGRFRRMSSETGGWAGPIKKAWFAA